MRYLSLVCLVSFALSATAAFVLACQSSSDPAPRDGSNSRIDGKTKLVETPPEEAPEEAIQEQMPNDERFHEVLLSIYGEYEHYEVTLQRYMAATQCAGPSPMPLMGSADNGPHGGKIAYYYAKEPKHYHLGGIRFVRDKGMIDPEEELDDWVSPTQPIGQAIVKKAGRRGTDEEAEKLDHYRWSTENYFIMTKLDPKTEGTDQGWVYGVINPEGVVTASGKIASCMGCHMKCEHDRMFGLSKALKAEAQEINGKMAEPSND